MPMSTTPLPKPRGLTNTLRTLRGLMTDPCPTLDRVGAEVGATFSVGAGPLRMVVVSDPRHLADLFATPVEAFRWGHWANVLEFVVGPTSMIVSDGEPHRHRRGAVQPALARRRLDHWIPMIVAETDRTIDHRLLTSDGPQDLYPVGRDLVFTITLQAFFGAGLQLHEHELSEIFELAQHYLEQPALRQVPHPLPLTKRARVRAGRDRFDHLVDAEVARRRARPAPEHTTDLLDSLLMAEGPARLTDQEIRDQVNTLIGAGYHTTSASLAWTIQRASTAPGVWDRLREEADTAFTGDLGGTTLNHLPFAAAVVHEALRLHPVGVFSPRQAVRDVKIGELTIPKGALVLWSPYLAGRDPSIWPDPLRFDPDRHLSPSPEMEAVIESAWVPFGRGPRRCIGFALAQMELTLILARLAQRATVVAQREETPHPFGMVVNRPSGGVPALVRVRAA